MRPTLPPTHPYLSVGRRFSEPPRRAVSRRVPIEASLRGPIGTDRPAAVCIRIRPSAYANSGTTKTGRADTSLKAVEP